MAGLSSRLARLEAHRRQQEEEAEAALLAAVSDATFEEYIRRLDDLIQATTLEYMHEADQRLRLVELNRWLQQRATEEEAAPRTGQQTESE